MSQEKITHPESASHNESIIPEVELILVVIMAWLLVKYKKHKFELIDNLVKKPISNIASVHNKIKETDEIIVYRLAINLAIFVVLQFGKELKTIIATITFDTAFLLSILFFLRTHYKDE